MSKFDNIDRKRFPIPSRETVSKCIDLHYEFKRKREMSGCHPQEATLNCGSCHVTHFISQIRDNDYKCRECSAPFPSALMRRHFASEIPMSIDMEHNAKTRHWLILEMEKMIERIEKLEKENEMRQDTIACIDSAYDKACRELDARLEKLEGYMEMEDRVTASDVLNRLTLLEDKKNLVPICTHIDLIVKLEKTVNSLVDKIAEIGNYYYQEKQMPYKCPVCNGEGLRFYKEENKRPFSQCEACEGSCVLWK